MNRVDCLTSCSGISSARNLLQSQNESAFPRMSLCDKACRSRQKGNHRQASSYRLVQVCARSGSAQKQKERANPKSMKVILVTVTLGDGGHLLVSTQALPGLVAHCHHELLPYALGALLKLANTRGHIFLALLLCRLLLSSLFLPFLHVVQYSATWAQLRQRVRLTEDSSTEQTSFVRVGTPARQHVRGLGWVPWCPARGVACGLSWQQAGPGRQEHSHRQGI